MLCPPRENPRLCEGVAFSDIASQSQVKTESCVRVRQVAESDTFAYDSFIKLSTEKVRQVAESDTFA